jgi:hypothetical protein
MPNGVPALESAQYIVLRSIEQREKKLAESSGQKSEIRRQRSGVKLISDLRLLTSVIDDFYAFYDFYDFYDFLGRTHLNLAIPYQDRGFLA